MKNWHILLLSVMIVACQPSETSSARIEKAGISFVCPEGWTLEDEEASEESFIMTP